MYYARDKSPQLLYASAANQTISAGTAATGIVYFTRLPADVDIVRCWGVGFPLHGSGTGGTYNIKGVIVEAKASNHWEPYRVVPNSAFNGQATTSGSAHRWVNLPWTSSPSAGRMIPGRRLYWAAWMFDPVATSAALTLSGSLTVHPGGMTAFTSTANAKCRYDLHTGNSLVVTGCVNNGSGLCRITITPESGASDHYIQTGMRVQTASIGGVTGANGTFLATRISTTQIDLQASTFSGAYTSGGTVVRWFNYADFDTSAFQTALDAMNWPYSFATASSGTHPANVNVAWMGVP